MPFPPPKEQAEIICQVEKLFALAHTIERRVQAATDRAEKLFEQAIECNPSCHEALHELSILSWASRLSKAKH